MAYTFDDDETAALPGKILGCPSYIEETEDAPGNLSEKKLDHTSDGWIYRAEAGRGRILCVGPIRSDKVPEHMEELSELAASKLRSSALSRMRSEQAHMLVKDYVSSIRSRQLLGIDGLKPYPYDREKQLVAAIASGDASAAKHQLNSILGFIFFSETRDMITIKTRAIELTVLISRAALDAGAEECGIYELCPQFITTIIQLESIDELCLELSEMLNRFMTLTFDRPDIRHKDIIARTVKYISDNYMHHITLEDTARKIFVSPSYLSRIFSSEMNVSFTDYLSDMRVQKSCMLLRGDTISVSEVSSLVGFSDQSYFNKVFKKKTGVTPKQYRDGKG